MPWKISDVDEHIKGLTDQERETWVKVANTVLAECLKADGEESECEGKAIRIANAVAKKEGKEKAQISEKPWGDVDKTKLPKECFLYVEDPEKKSTWKLPVYEGAGEIGEEGLYEGRGPLNRNGVYAAAAAMAGAHGVKPKLGDDFQKVAKRLVALYKDELDEEPPDALLKAAGISLEKGTIGKIRILLKNEKEHLLYTPFLIPDTPDTDKDKITEDEIRWATHKFMMKAMPPNLVDVMHDGKDHPGIHIVEIFQAPVNFVWKGKAVKEGTGIIVYKILEPEVWAKVEAQELEATSIKGQAAVKEKSNA